MWWFLFLCAVCMSVSAELRRFEHPVVKPDGSLSFLAIGDWGRRGDYNQSQIAHQVISGPFLFDQKKRDNIDHLVISIMMMIYRSLVFLLYDDDD